MRNTKNPNEANNFGQTALYIFIVRGVPVEFMEDLIKKGLDVNVKCKKTGFDTGSIRIPLLSHCIINKRYEALGLLLQYGANPNAMPEKERMYLSDDINNEL